MIIDDSPQITSLLREVFGNRGAEVTTTNSAREAMGLLQLNRYDLVVLDLIMPEISGRDVLNFMKTVCPEAMEHTVLLTGDRYSSSSRSCLRGMGIPVLYKPFKLDELHSAARAALLGHGETSAA